MKGRDTGRKCRRSMADVDAWEGEDESEKRRAKRKKEEGAEMTRNLLARKGAIRDLNSTWLPHKNVRAFASKMENKIPAFFNHRTFILCLCIYIYIFWGGRKGSRRTSQSRQKIKAFPLTALLFVLSVVCSPFHQNLWLIGT